MKLIKRYANRKLYDTERSCYVRLDEIAEMVRAGEELQIIDNRSGEDLTSVTLAQIVLEEEKRSKKVFPLQTLRIMIQQPSELIARLSRPVNELRDDAQRQVERLRRRGEATLPEESRSPIREFLDSAQRALDEMQQGFDERLRATMGTLTHVPHLYDELERVHQRLDALEEENRRLRRALLRTEREARLLVRSHAERSPLPGDERRRS